jgi:Ser/Thr protein kinase RdoA (MazF antagonist)
MSTTVERTLEAKLAAITEHFGLGLMQHFERASGTNQNYLVTTSSGDYLFKIIVNITLQDVLNSLPFLQRLEEQGFAATAYYLTAPTGRAFYHSPDCDAVVLRRLSGSTPAASLAVCRAVGVHLAKMHLISCVGLPEKRHWLDDQYLPNTLQTALERYGAERLSETLKVFNSLSDFHPATFPQAIVHGDLYADNCLFEGERLVAFVDWEEIGVSAALMDFVKTVQGFCFVEDAAQPQYWAVFDPDRYRAFYESYTSIRPFSHYELEHLDNALKYVGLTGSVWLMLAWERYHPGEEMVETQLLYWKFGLDKLTLPVL